MVASAGSTVRRSARICQVPDLPAARQHPPETITAGGLTLRRWQLDDLDALHSAVIASIEHLRPWMVWAANEDIAGQRQYLETSGPAWENGERFEYAVIDERGAVVGSCGLMARIGPGGLEIGYWVHAEHTGRGIATLAAAALVETAFTLPWVDRVEIHHDEANLASGAVPKKLGFQMIDRIRRTPLTPADSGVDLIWSLGRSAYPASRCRRLLQSASSGS